MIGAPEDDVYAGGLTRAWVDDRIGEDARVVKLYFDTECGSALTRHALFLSEFFNESVRRAAHIGDTVPDGIPSDRVDLDGGRLLFESGSPLVADYVYTQPGIELNGERVATGTNANLVLWRIDGPVSVDERPHQRRGANDRLRVAPSSGRRAVR